MTTQNANATARANTGGPERAQAVSANDRRVLDYLTVDLGVGDLTFTRDVQPVGEATVDEIVAAMKEDEDFLNPFVKRGKITVLRGRKRVVLASYYLGDVDGWLDSADIYTATAHFDDDTCTKVIED